MNTKTIPPGPAIIVAGLVIAIAIFITNSPKGNFAVKTGADKADTANTESAPATLTFNLKDPGEHVSGSSKPKVVIVEYSDIDCPFCIRFHPVLQQAVKEYEGQVAWIYRHFPLEGLHPDAFTKAMATECVAQSLGNDAFWNYLDTLITKKVGVDQLDDEAIKLGMSADDFTNCMASAEVKSAVQADIESGIALGTEGTPNSILVNEAGEQEFIKGAADYADVKAKIDKLLGK